MSSDEAEGELIQKNSLISFSICVLKTSSFKRETFNFQIGLEGDSCAKVNTNCVSRVAIAFLSRLAEYAR